MKLSPAPVVSTTSTCRDAGLSSLFHASPPRRPCATGDDCDADAADRKRSIMVFDRCVVLAGRTEGDRQAFDAEIGGIGIDGDILRDADPGCGERASQRAAIVQPADMDVVHGLQDSTSSSAWPVAGADAEILEQEHTLAGWKHLDLGMGGVAGTFLHMRYVNAVLSQEHARVRCPSDIRTDGTEIVTRHGRAARAVPRR